MKLNRENISQMPRNTRRQEARRNEALKKLKQAEQLESRIEKQFEDSIRLDGSSMDRNPEPGIYTYATERKETSASQHGESRSFYQSGAGPSVRFARQYAFSTLFAGSKTTETSRMQDDGDRTVYTTRKVYKDHRCPYPNETTTVIKYQDGDNASYKVYDGWIASKLAQFGVL